MNVADRHFVDLPFLPPPDIVIDVPVPPSVNKTRKVNWAAKPEVEAWIAECDKLCMVAWARGRKPPMIPGRFEATIVLDERAPIDLDNGLKILIDYARRVELIIDDDKRYMRALHLVWGAVPEGCRLILKRVA